jgi:hypothetical protein
MTERVSTIECRMHGPRPTAVVCRHMIESIEARGFVENNSDPEDLQAWCYSCELMYEREQALTEAFRDFNRFAVVCVDCYTDLKKRHGRPV